MKSIAQIENIIDRNADEGNDIFFGLSDREVEFYNSKTSLYVEDSEFKEIDSDSASVDAMVKFAYTSSNDYESQSDIEDAYKWNFM